MADWRVVRLNFKGCPIHFGKVGIGLESSSDRARSDTLFGAWIHAYAKLFGNEAVKTLLENAFAALTDEERKSTLPMDATEKRKPLIRMSSTFPYHYRDKTYKDYLPKPLILLPELHGDTSQFKIYKKLKYLPLKIWQKWYQTNEESQKKNLDEVVQEKKERGVLWKNDTVPRVALDRATQASNFYHAGFTWFRYDSDEDYAGLYFLLALEEKGLPYEQNLQAALHFLGEEGLGGERSSGAGRFEIAQWQALDGDWEKLVEAQFSHYCLLSLWWQKEKTMPENWCQDTTQYKLVERGGWVGSPFSGRQALRKKVRMFEEGSVFPVPPEGHLADVTPPGFHQHPVYRNGIALSLPLRVPETNAESNSEEKSGAKS